VNSGFRREVAENCALLGYYAASSGNFLPTFGEKLSVLSSCHSKDGSDTMSPNVGKKKKYHYPPRNSPEQHSSHVTGQFAKTHD
jgi:hypothetical protein